MSDINEVLKQDGKDRPDVALVEVFEYGDR